MKYLQAAFISMVLLAVITVNGFSQNLQKDSTTVPRSFWVAGGLGASSLGSVSVTANGNLEIKNHLLLSLYITAESNRGILDFSSGNEKDVTAASFLIGKVFKHWHSLFSASAGVGYIDVYSDQSTGGIFGTVTNKKDKYTVVVPIVLQAYVVAFHTLGLGLGGYVNLNTIQTTAGLHLSVALGRITGKPYLPRRKHQ